MLYEYSDNRINNWNSNGSTIPSLGALNGVRPFLFWIPSPGNRKVPNSEAYFYSTNKICHRELIYTNCYWKTAYCLSFKMSHVSLYLLCYSLRHLLRNPHHCDDANFFHFTFHCYYSTSKSKNSVKRQRIEVKQSYQVTSTPW